VVDTLRRFFGEENSIFPDVYGRAGVPDLPPPQHGKHPMAKRPLADILVRLGPVLSGCGPRLMKMKPVTSFIN
jgi:hypothetical protein